MKKLLFHTLLVLLSPLSVIAVGEDLLQEKQSWENKVGRPIVFCAFPASGKSTLAQSVAPFLTEEFPIHPQNLFSSDEFGGNKIDFKNNLTKGKRGTISVIDRGNSLKVHRNEISEIFSQKDEDKKEKPLLVHLDGLSDEELISRLQQRGSKHPTIASENAETIIQSWRKEFQALDEEDYNNFEVLSLKATDSVAHNLTRVLTAYFKDSPEILEKLSPDKIQYLLTQSQTYGDVFSEYIKITPEESKGSGRPLLISASITGEKGSESLKDRLLTRLNETNRTLFETALSGKELSSKLATTIHFFQNGTDINWTISHFPEMIDLAEASKNGKTEQFEITGIAWDDKAVGLTLKDKNSVIEGMRTSPAHLTFALAKGTPPVHTGQMLQNKEGAVTHILFETPLEIEGNFSIMYRKLFNNHEESSKKNQTQLPKGQRKGKEKTAQKK